LLDPLDPLFAKISAMWIEEQTRLFGTDHYYAADTFIEMRPPSGDLKYLDRLARAIYGGMATSDSKAVWVLQTWIFLNQRDFWSQDRIEAFLDAVPQDRMLCLDLSCENRPQWSRTNAFSGKPWLWCNIQDWGRTVFLGGALNNMVSGLPAARRDPKSGSLSGLGFVNEGLGYNPVAYDLLFELAWRDETVDLGRWLKDYAHHRYGADNANAASAWQILKDTVYNGPHVTRSTIDQMPTLSSARNHISYDNRALTDAWRQLLAASNELGNRDTYQFDLVNIGRQVLVNHAAVLHRDVIRAYQAKDLEAFDKATERFLQLFRDVDGLLATRQEFLLGRWLEDAKRWGATDAERNKLEWNARRVLTLWGQTPAIDDYARKDWSGMVDGYYLHRWQTHLNAANQSLKQGRPFDAKASNAQLRKWMAQWSDQHEQYPAEPHGDSVAVANRLWHKYADTLKTDSLKVK
jgi:alpha-N-acetylglucosaminidase